MGMAGNYRIHLYRDDETLSLVMVFHARADRDAKDEAEKMLQDGLVRAEIWRDDVKIGTLDYRTALPSVVSDQWVPDQWRIAF